MNLRADVAGLYVWVRGMTSDDGYIAQAAAIPFRMGDGGRVEVLLIRRRGKKKWGIPKGLVDPGHTPEQAALIEAEEEAGIEGSLVGEPLGHYTYDKFGGTCRVTVFALRVTAERERFLEQQSRERRWFALDEAVNNIGRPDVGEMIRALSARVK